VVILGGRCRRALHLAVLRRHLRELPGAPDLHEPEFGVQMPWPVVGVGEEPDEVCAGGPSLGDGAQHHRTAGAPVAERHERVHVLHLRDALVQVQLAVGGQLAVELDREVELEAGAKLAEVFAM